MGPMRLLSVPGRKSGRLRTTPVSPLTVAGERYVVAVFDDTDWVRNARAAGWGILARGRKRERVTLSELPVEERAPVLREVPREVPQSARFLREGYGIRDEPEAYAALAPRCPVFRIGSASQHNLAMNLPASVCPNDGRSRGGRRWLRRVGRGLRVWHATPPAQRLFVTGGG